MSDPYAMAAAAKAQAAADRAIRTLNEVQAQQAADPVQALKEHLTRLELKIDAIGLLLAGRKYAEWDSADWHQSRGLK